MADSDKPADEELDLSEVDDTNEIVQKWEDRGITIEQLQVLATSKDFRSAHLLERIAHNMMHKNNGGIGLAHSFLRTKEGVAVAKAVKDLLSSAATLRNMGIDKQIKKRALEMQEELENENSSTPVEAEVKTNPLLERIEQMKKDVGT